MSNIIDYSVRRHKRYAKTFYLPFIHSRGKDFASLGIASCMSLERYDAVAQVQRQDHVTSGLRTN